MSVNVGERLTLWCGDGLRHASENVWTECDERYVGFKLKPGESVVLRNADGTVVDAVTIPNDIATDEVYVRNIDKKWHLFQKSWNVEYHGYTEDIVASESELIVANYDSGFYDAPLLVELGSAAGDIYYTLDGTEPSLESSLYTGPIEVKDISSNQNLYSAREDLSIINYFIPYEPVDKATILRAVCLNKNGEKLSKELIRTYFIDYGTKKGYGTVSTISLTTNPDNLFGYEHDIYVLGLVNDLVKDRIGQVEYEYARTPANYNRTGKNWKRPAYIEYYDKNGLLVYAQNVNIGIHGAYTRFNSQKGLNIFALDGEYIFDDWSCLKLKSIELRSALEFTPTKLREVYIQKLTEERDVLTSPSEPVQLFIDGEYWGLYNLQERVSVDAVAATYNLNSEDIVLMRCGELVSDDEQYESCWDEVERYIIENDMSDVVCYERANELIDMQSYIDYCMIEVYCGNIDSISNNYAMWRTINTDIDSEWADCRWRWILYDLDEGLGGEAAVVTDSFKEGNFGHHVLDDEMFCSLMANECFRQQVAATMLELSENCFEKDKALKLLDELEALYTPLAVKSAHRFVSDTYTEEDYHSCVEYIRYYMSNRREYILKYLESDIIEYDIMEYDNTLKD